MNILSSISHFVQRGLAILTAQARTRSGLILILLGAGVLLSSCLSLFMFVMYFLMPDQLNQPSLQASPLIQTPLMPLSLATQECPPPSLALGEKTFAVQAVSLTNDELPAPPESADLVYRIVKDNEDWGFLLGSAAFGADSIPLDSLTQAVYSDENCNVTVYQLSTPQPVQWGGIGAASFSPSELVILIQTGADGSGFAFYGATVAQEIHPVRMPSPAPDEVQAEIGLLEARMDDAEQLIRLRVSVYNFGSQALTLTENDVSLLGADGAVISLNNSRPALPQTIPPGQTLEVELDFLMPTQGTDVLRIFTIEFDLADVSE